MLRALLGIALLLYIAAILSAQTPSQLASLEGLVLRSGSDEPIANAMVVIGPATRPAGNAVDRPMAPVITDSSGHFSISGVPPGSYVLFADAMGYSRQILRLRQSGTSALTVAGQFPSGTVIAVKAAGTVKDLTFHMVPAIVMSGRILGSSGNALPGMRVEFLPVGYDSTGRKLATLAGNAETNDRGEFRAFTLEPGRYYIAAKPTRYDANASKYLQTYYPGVASLEQALAIEIKPGEALNKLDFSMVDARGVQRYKVRGRLIDQTTGRSPVGIAPVLNLIPRDAQYLNSIDTFPLSDLPPDGAFEIPDVAPGKYWLSTRISSTSAVLPIDIAAADVDGIRLSLSPPQAISGRVSIEGGDRPNGGLNNVRLQLETLRVGAFPVNMMPPSPPTSSPKQDGTFVLTGVFPGQYDLTISEMPPDVYVKQAMYGEIDALNTSLNIRVGTDSPLQIVLGAKAGQLVGTIVGRDQKPIRDAQAVLIPVTLPNRHDLYKTATSDTNGQFHITSISPGEYKVFAWESVGRFEYFDTAFVREFEALSKRVNIAEGARETVSLQLIPAGTR